MGGGCRGNAAGGSVRVDRFWLVDTGGCMVHLVAGVVGWDCGRKPIVIEGHLFIF